jgi:hypothetical protein
MEQNMAERTGALNKSIVAEEENYGSKQSFLSAMHDIIKLRTEFTKNWVDLTLKLMIRWYHQLDENGHDTYGKWLIFNSMYRYTYDAAVKENELRKQLNIQKTNLDTNNDEDAKIKLYKSLKLGLHYEHNVPVKLKVKEIIDLHISKTVNSEFITLEELHQRLNEQYEIIIITEEQRIKLDTPTTIIGAKGKRKTVCYKESGGYNERLSIIGVAGDEFLKKKDENFSDYFHRYNELKNKDVEIVN